MNQLNFGALTQHLRLPDIWQQEAVQHLRNGFDVIVDAPTGAGKTLVFEMARDAIKWRGQLVYTVPTRALANDKRWEWREKGWRVGIATGDISDDTEAPVLVATLETQLDRLRGGDAPALLVLDEYQMLGDARRGDHYEMAVAEAPADCRLLFLSGSVSNPQDIGLWLEKLQRPVKVITHRHRPVPLEDMPARGLPRKAPASIQGRWPRLAAEVLLGGLAPLLLFAPRRAEAESIARRMLAGLPPCRTPLALSEEQAALCGPDLRKALEQRVAWHHSGLSYAVRAGVIEPSAKRGHLRVIVATTGLAAGINFSVRSVLVTETTYFDGIHRRDLRQDELLQMFGRAGRRGLDERGYVIALDHGPRLGDAALKKLQRNGTVGWPFFLRVMDHAAARGLDPRLAAQSLAARLFTKHQVPLGWESPGLVPAEPGGRSVSEKPIFGLTPKRKELRRADGVWEPWKRSAEGRAPFGETWVMNGEKGPRRAATMPVMVARIFQEWGRPFPLRRDLPGEWGREIVLAHEGKESWILSKSVGKRLGLSRAQWSTSAEELESIWKDRVLESLPGVVVRQSGSVEARYVMLLDVRSVLVPAIQDSSGRWWFEPEVREVDATGGLEEDLAVGESLPQPGSHAAAWLALGFIKTDGTPTQRGRIFSRFLQSEGLAVAAALEDETYPVDELVWDLANLRAGYRFELDEVESAGHDRLAVACRAAYGLVSHEGWLEMGLPPGYGAGAGQALQLWKRDGHRLAEGEFLRRGDLERAFREWLSLLRGIAAFPRDEERIGDLRKEALKCLEAYAPKQNTEAPKLWGNQLSEAPIHRL